MSSDTPNQAISDDFSARYSVVRQTADVLVAELDLPHSHACFKDHFPGQPIVPGVIQLRWVFELAAAFIPNHQRYDVVGLKFTNVILPARPCTLTISRQDADRIAFRYTGTSVTYSSGMIHFRQQPDAAQIASGR
jgi:3-hydroxymyristoyl/3-hydroxydecanoyl-(acyl carrier protein) dehydratase